MCVCPVKMCAYKNQVGMCVCSRGSVCVCVCVCVCADA